VECLGLSGTRDGLRHQGRSNRLNESRGWPSRGWRAVSPGPQRLTDPDGESDRTALACYETRAARFDCRSRQNSLSGDVSVLSRPGRDSVGEADQTVIGHATARHGYCHDQSRLSRIGGL